MNPTRRQLLLAAAGAAGGATLLAACNDDKDAQVHSNATDNVAKVDSDTVDKGFYLVQRFPGNPLFVPGVESRLPVSIMRNSDGALRDNGPATFNGWIEDFNGEKVVDVVGTLRNDGISAAYWEVRATLPKAIIYSLRFEGGDENGAKFEVWDPEYVHSPKLNEPLLEYDTPTKDDHRGVEPYCSRPTPCPFHDITLTEALASGKPVIYMIGTPAHCTTGTCGPGLEFLIEEGERLGDQIAIVHADVYADDQATVVAPAILALNIEYEPILYFVDAGGIIVDRLDGVWDRSELRERVDQLLAP